MGDSMTPQRTYRRSGHHLTKEQRKQAQETFLAAFAVNANVMLSCKRAGVSRNTIYEWGEHDTEFSLRFKQAELDANDVIRAAMYQRAVQGVEKPALSMGRVVYAADGKPLMLREYSDSLLSLLAKARMPEFRDRGPSVNVLLPKEYVGFNPAMEGTEE